MMRGISAILGSIFAERQKPRDRAFPAEVQLSASPAAAGLYAPNSRTLMLESVLSQQAGGASPRPVRDDKTDMPASAKIRIGDELRQTKEAVATCGASLARLGDTVTTDYLARLIAVTEGQQCQIAFIGQMNAGKSTLINALVDAPNLLPSEITPWTTVVTNLYFGVPGKPTAGAVFEFFNEEEWRQLSEGGGRVRAITERLMPDFPWHSFQEQVNALRESAERRLGSRYRDLLGKQHAHAALEEGLLARYVAAQSPLADADEEGPAPGEFSTITKAAHIYFDLTNFFYPTVLIDTPGINDPFLVRDEITRQNLERANIFVIVVTARQPLSNVDLDLLRILHGLRKENFIIFVNKIDEVDRFEEHAESIVGRIRALITREFPEAEFTIITGCAEWAAIGLGQDTALQQEVAARHGISSAPALMAVEDSKHFWLPDPGAADAALADAILTRSAIPDLANAISGMLHSGAIAGGLRHTAAVLKTLSENGLARAEAETALMVALAEGAAGGKGDKAAEVAGRLDEASAIATEMAATLGGARAAFESIVAGAGQTLSSAVTRKLANHVRILREGFSPRDGAAVRHALSTELRALLETEFGAVFQETVAAIGREAIEAQTSLAAGVGRVASLLDTRLAYPALPAVKCSPSLAPLGEPLSIEFGGAAYMSSWARLPVEERQRSLTVVEAEFIAIIARLAQSAEEELTRTTRFVLDHLRVNALHAVQITIDRRRALAEDWAGAASDDDTDGRLQRIGERLARLEAEAGAFAQAASAIRLGGKGKD